MTKTWQKLRKYVDSLQFSEHMALDDEITNLEHILSFEKPATIPDEPEPVDGVEAVERGASYPPPKLCRSLHDGGLDT